jgi:hypothetical protein
MTIKKLDVYYPRYVTLQSGEKVLIPEKSLTDEELFSLLVPIKKIDEIVKYLKTNDNFHDAIPSLPKSEDYSISKVIFHPWELHLRLYHDSPQPLFGKIQAHFEVSRNYFEHLSIVQPVIYEPFEFYRDIFPNFIVWYNPRSNWISSINENYKISLPSPSNLTPWKPVVATVAAVSIFAGILYALDKLSKPKEK